MSVTPYAVKECFTVKVVLPMKKSGRWVVPSATAYDRFRKVYARVELTDEFVAKMGGQAIRFFVAWFNKKKKLIIGDPVENQEW